MVSVYNERLDGIEEPLCVSDTKHQAQRDNNNRNTTSSFTTRVTGML